MYDCSIFHLLEGRHVLDFSYILHSLCHLEFSCEYGSGIRFEMIIKLREV